MTELILFVESLLERYGWIVGVFFVIWAAIFVCVFSFAAAMIFKVWKSIDRY